MLPEDFLETIINNSPAYVMVLDINGSIQFVNRTAGNRQKGSVLGQSVFEGLANQEEIAKLKDCLNQIKQLKTTLLLEQKASSPEGITCYWETRVSPILNADEVTGFVLFSNDITIEKAAQMEQQAIFDLSTDFLCILKFDGFFSRVNPAFIDKLGYTEQELLSIPLRDLLHPDDRDKTLVAFSQMTSLGIGESPIENRYIGKNGNIVSIEWRGSIDTEANRIIGVGRDVSASRELEDQLRQAQKMEAIGLLAGGIAHDFNNLLMAISANAEMGMISSNLEDVKTRLRDIESASERAAQLTHKLLSLSRNQPLQKKPLDLNHLIQNFQRLLDRALPANMQFSFDPQVKLPQIAGDKLQLEQALMNLCINARDSMPEGGTICISTSHNINGDQSDTVNLDISDTGGGIADSVKDRIYIPFFTTKPDVQGTGLGLSMVYGIMKKHGGNVSILNTNTSGTTMRLSFPALKRVCTPDNSKSQCLPFGGSETILVAEDERLVAKITKETLEKAGYTVLLATNGAEAVETFSTNKSIQLVFMDVIMPEMGGPEAASIIKQTNPDIPILFASGYAPDPQKHMPTDYIVLNKPYRGDELLSTIRNLLDN